MKPRLTPAQPVLVGFTGFVLCAASFFLIGPARTAAADAHLRWFYLLLSFGLFIGGMVISVKASSALKNGIANRQWPEEQIEPLRSWLESPLFNALPITLIVAYGILWLVFPKYRLIGLACFTLMQVLSQLRTAIRRRPADPSNPIAGWRDLSPIHSDHWGRR